MTTDNIQQQTQEHYEEHPFDFLTEEDEKNIAGLQPIPFRNFVSDVLQPGCNILEVGCGPGRGTLFMVESGFNVTAVDISRGSLILAKRRAPEAKYVEASNLELPFKDCEFDAVVSDGVIHHTPDPFRSLSENVRVLKERGNLYLAVYRRKRYYYYLYKYVGKPIRWLEKRGWGRFLIHSTLLPVYYLVHLLKSRGKRTWVGSKSFFYDYIITPRATFHTREEVEDWGRKLSLQLENYVENVGNVHAFVFQKCGGHKSK